MVIINLTLLSIFSNDTLINDGNPAQDKYMFNPKRSDELPLTDKVYTFMAPNDRISFTNYFEEHYMYNIHIELVTEHNCTMSITLFDHDDKQFNIFDAPMFYNPEFGRHFDIPFGTVKAGLYNISFETSSSLNFNMHILIEKGLKCLHDKMNPKHIEELVLYDVQRFYNGKHVSYQFRLETDEMYKFYIGRVSPITIKNYPEVRVDYTITDPDEIVFVYYSDDPIAGIHGVSSFDFGTASEGIYTIDITAYITDPGVEWVNIAYAAADDYIIGDVVDVNSTKSDVKESNSEDPDMFDELIDNSLILPIEWTIGTLLFIGGLAGVIVVMLVQHRKDNVVSLSIKNK